MILENLLNLVNDLKLRIKEHEAQLRSNERQTRYALIDPLLRELGWDTSDPSLVTPEISASGGRADYALLKNGRPVVMVEAKRLGEDLQGAVSQGVQYCLERGTQHFAVTDGQRWAVYETHRPVPIEQKKVVSFDIMHDAAATVCLEALALWRPSVLDGSVRAGIEPVVGLPDEETVSFPTVSPTRPTEPEASTSDSEWKPIGSLDFTTLLTNAKGTPIAPVELMFPDGSFIKVGSWADATTSMAKWLVENSLLTEAHCPVQAGGRTRYVMATSPFHANGTPMSLNKPVGPFYMEADYTARDLSRNAKALIEHVGQNPSKFRLRFP